MKKIFYCRCHEINSFDGRVYASTLVRMWRENWFGDQFDVVSAYDAIGDGSREIRYLHDYDDTNDDWDGETYLTLKE